MTREGSAHPSFQVADGLSVSDPQVDQVGRLAVGEPDAKAESLLLVWLSSALPFALGLEGGCGRRWWWWVERRVLVHGDRLVAV